MMLETANVPDAPALEQKRETILAILFADVSGSTRLYETLGDARARSAIGRIVELMSAAARRHGGTLVKTIGDEVMCRFPGADDAAAAALEMQESVTSAALAPGGVNAAIHVGFHFGPVVIEEDGDLFGDAVNVASRMVNLAKRDQVLTTGAAVARLSAPWRAAARQVDRAAVRGKSEPIDVYELVWQEADATRISGKAWAVAPEARPAVLELRWGAHQLEVSRKHPTVTVGRGEQNELVVPNDVVSRLHARIEYRNGRFSFTDQSTNGSYVINGAGGVHQVRRDSVVLTGSGAISLGQEPGPVGGLVRYSIRS
jgi:class 3 adenylate cyclase